jgi:glycosyltransferase involved in cell wall biosynthesis
MLQLAPLVFDRDIWCVVHDPVELFPKSPDWKSKDADTVLVRSLEKLERVIVTSAEMEGALSRLGLDVAVVPTDSRLPMRAAEELEPIARPITVTTVGRVYRRKNYEMYKHLAHWAERERLSLLRFRPKWGFAPLPQDTYVAFLDEAQIYLCTSFQEGGPIPAMDAMRRGLVVLSTPVGQMPERIVHGETGFICRTAVEFEKRLKELAGDPERLQSMRLASLQHAIRFREEGSIAHSVATLINTGFAARQ